MKSADINQLVWASDPQLSPSGNEIAYVVTRVDETANRYRSRVWLIDSDGESLPRAVSAGEDNDGSPRWSPDGRSLAFTSTRRKDAAGKTKSALYVLNTSGPGEASLVCEHDEGIQSPTFSPDGRWIAFAARTRGEHYDSDDTDRRPPRKVDRPLYYLNGEGVTFDRPAHVYVIPTDGSGSATDLTPGDADISDPAWYPDSKRLAATRSNSAERLLGSDIATIDIDTAEVTIVTNGTGAYGLPAVGPDDTIALAGYDDHDVFPQNSRIGLLSPGSSDPVWISTSVDRDWNSFPIARPPQWNHRSVIDRDKSENGVIGVVADRGLVHLHRLDTNGEISELVGGPRWVTGFTANDTTIAFTAESSGRPGELFVQHDGVETRLTDLSARFVAATSPVTAQHFVATNADTEVDAWIYLPHDFDATKKYPMLLNIHGGPFTQYGDFFYDEAQLEARAGFVVIMANPRGGSGRDTEWAEAIRGPALGGPGWGTVDYEDLMAVVDTALAQYPFIDAERLGVLGGSYGGYMTSWIIGHTDRFAAACSERAVNNLATLDVTSDIGGVAEFWFGRSAFNDPTGVAAMSPITYVDEMTTPLLIVHSDADLRCPHEQADQLYLEMRRRDRDVEYYLFPDETHELSRSGSPTHRVQRADLIIEFFQRHLGITTD